MSFGSLTQGLRPGLQIRRRYAARALANGVHCQIIQIISVPRVYVVKTKAGSSLRSE